MPLYPVQNDYPDAFKIPPANRIARPGSQTLFKNATGFEAALADTDAERIMDIYAEAIIDEWNPWQVAYEHLPFLAWAMGVNLWEHWWDETFRRSWVARQWYLKSVRGKRAGLDEFVVAVGGQVKRCIVPPARAYGTKAMTDEERAAYVARFPQLRIYPYVARSLLPWLCYCGVHWDGTGQHRRWNKNGNFLGPRWKMYPTIQTAGGKYTRTATYYEPRTGVETKLTIRKIVKILTGESAGWGYTPGVSQYDETVILPLEHRPAYFIRERRKYLGVNIYLGIKLPLRTISIGRSGPLELFQAKAQYQTIFPQEELLRIRPEFVGVPHFRRKTELYAARREYLIRARDIVSHLVAASGMGAGSPQFGRVTLKEFSAESMHAGSPVIGFPVPVLLHRIANYDVDTSAWIMMVDAIGGSTSTPLRVAVDNFIKGLKTDGVWVRFDRLWFYATEDIYGAVPDLKRRKFISVNGSPYFLPNRGFTCTGSSGYVGLNYRIMVDGEVYTQNSAHLSCWNLTDGTNALPALVGNGAGGHENIFPKYTDNNVYARINDNPDTNGFAIGDCRGLILGNRSSVTARQIYRNGVSLGAYPSNNSQTPSNLELIVLSREVAMVSIGASLSTAEQLAFYNRARTLMTARGVP